MSPIETDIFYSRGVLEKVDSCGLFGVLLWLLVLLVSFGSCSACYTTPYNVYVTALLCSALLCSGIRCCNIG